MYSGRDRRVFSRVEGRLILRCGVEGGRREFCTATKNISGSGIRILLLGKISPGTILDMEIFRKNSEESVKCRGQIVWISSSGTKKTEATTFEAGIEFIDSDLMYIGRLIKDLDVHDVSIPSPN